VPTSDDEKPGTGRIVAAIILTLFAIAFVVVAYVYATTPDYKLPGYLGFAHSRGHHTLRMVGSFLVGIAFAIGAWFALRYQSLALEEAREAERAALAEAEEAAAQGEQATRLEADPAGAPETDSAQASQSISTKA
jgi:hypothetical protein